MGSATGTAGSAVIEQGIALEVQKELLSSMYSQANAYTNLILGAGYAGFFGVWTFTRDQLNASQVFWSAILVTISLVSFVAFEVYKNLYISRGLLSLNLTIQDEQQIAANLLRWREDQRDREITFGRVWASTCWISILSGFGGGLVLLYSFVRGLLGVYVG